MPPGFMRARRAANMAVGEAYVKKYGGLNIWILSQELYIPTLSGSLFVDVDISPNFLDIFEGVWFPNVTALERSWPTGPGGCFFFPHAAGRRALRYL